MTGSGFALGAILIAAAIPRGAVHARRRGALGPHLAARSGARLERRPGDADHDRRRARPRSAGPALAARPGRGRVRDGRRDLPAGDQHAHPTARPGRPPCAGQRGHAGHGPAGRHGRARRSPASRSRSSASVPRSPSMPCPSPSPRARCGWSARAPDPVIRPIRSQPPDPAAASVRSGIRRRRRASVAGRRPRRRCARGARRPGHALDRHRLDGDQPGLHRADGGRPAVARPRPFRIGRVRARPPVRGLRRRLARWRPRRRLDAAPTPVRVDRARPGPRDGARAGGRRPRAEPADRGRHRPVRRGA